MNYLAVQSNSDVSSEILLVLLFMVKKEVFEWAHASFFGMTKSKLSRFGGMK